MINRDHYKLKLLKVKFKIEIVSKLNKFKDMNTLKTKDLALSGTKLCYLSTALLQVQEIGMARIVQDPIVNHTWAGLALVLVPQAPK